MQRAQGVLAHTPPGGIGSGSSSPPAAVRNRMRRPRGEPPSISGSRRFRRGWRSAGSACMLRAMLFLTPHARAAGGAALFAAGTALAGPAAAPDAVPDAETAATNAPAAGLQWAGFPVAFYTPETGAGFGGGLTVTHRPDGADRSERPDSLSVFGLYTLKNQWMLFAMPEAYLADHAWKARGRIGYRDYPDQFHGIGPEATEDAEEDFTERSLTLEPSLFRSVVPNLWIGGLVRWKDTDLSAFEDDGVLAQGGVTGTEGGTAAGAGPAIEWDGRDRLFNPTRGGFHRFTAVFHRDALSSDYDYDEYTLDLRHYLPAGREGVVALQGVVQSVSGDVPFTELPRLEQMRGVLNNLYRDRRAAVAQAEYRFPIRGRFSGVAFASVGGVAPSWDEWDFGDLKAAGGAGLRFMLNRRERINLRFDLGFSESGAQPYIRIMEAF